jgi:hypothetical protein
MDIKEYARRKGMTITEIVDAYFRELLAADQEEQDAPSDVEQI